MKGIKMEPNIEQLAPVLSLGIIAVIILFALIGIAIGIILWCKIFSKTGYSWAMGLLILIPFGNLIIMLILAFGDWPILKELRALKAQPAQATE